MTWFRCGMKKSMCVNQLDELLDGSITEITSDVTSLRDYGLNGCTALTTVSMPNITSVPQYCFRSCSSLVNVNIPNVQTVGLRSFSYSGITLLDTKLHSINNYAFATTNLSTLIMRDNYRSNLSNVNAFEATPFDVNGAGGKLYVPQSLLTDYQNNATWADLLALNANNQILAIEGSPYEEV